MTKSEIKEVVNEFTDNKKINNPLGFKNIIVMDGCYYWKKKKYIRKEVLIAFLAWQCRYLNGGIDENELATCCEIFRTKIIMI